MAHSLRGGGFDASEDGTGRGTPLVAVPQGVALRGRDGGATAELTGDVMTSLRTGGGGGDKPHALVPTFALQAGVTRENPDSGPDGVGVQRDCAYTIEARPEVQAVAFAENTRNELRLVDGDGGIAPSLQTQGGKAGRGYPVIAFNARQDPDVYDGHSGSLDANGASQGIFSRWRVRRLMPVECERLQGFPDGYTDVPYRHRNWTADGPRYKALGNSMAVNVMKWIGRRIEMVEKIKP